ncbi:hypothetical protein BSL82_15885 [Tardibacter chloracetimidivorans]|uniref:Tyr recombinase domain-containing protein n=2 Tax=Tardibacter chloracetimidivorans TaxID=1921510 RepID=A0A1L3ZY76_9SPHN|nr:hypothetical protein BSL82_15885 [Tardibacter chloracetimidivorans]
MPSANGNGPLLVKEAVGDPEEGSDATASYWHEHVLRNVIGVDTQRYAARKINQHFGHLAIRDIQQSDIDAYIDARRAGRLGRPSKDGTIARELPVLTAAINHAIRNKRLSADDAPRFKLPPASDPKDRWLAHEEADRLLAAALQSPAPKGKLPRIYKFVVLALATWSRKTALVTLRKDQVDLANRMIYLNPHGRRQTKKRRPPVPIADWALPIITRMMDEADGIYLLGDIGSIRTAFASATKRANLKGVTPHTLRHTGATWAAQAGVSLEDIGGVLGDDIRTVYKTYLHHCPEHLRKAVNAIRKAA